MGFEDQDLMEKVMGEIVVYVTQERNENIYVEPLRMGVEVKLGYLNHVCSTYLNKLPCGTQMMKNFLGFLELMMKDKKLLDKMRENTTLKANIYDLVKFAYVKLVQPSKDSKMDGATAKQLLEKLMAILNGTSGDSGNAIRENIYAVVINLVNGGISSNNGGGGGVGSGHFGHGNRLLIDHSPDGRGVLFCIA
eukprot:gnl/Chilomastix_caulleri/1233.p1 GENE.gnl/Chilomastix_caulleri/1233~~gnl/Chilomastix_caulleri/1233.p1  ORF type:complete len:193 (+),score=59.78 gnl/Chilomastix_caulleri/1233:577-1155(+)